MESKTTQNARYLLVNLGFEIADSGIPLPAHCLTDDHMSAVDIQASLPEGGFGWFLIRQLSYDITPQAPQREKSSVS